MKKKKEIISTNTIVLIILGIIGIGLVVLILGFTMGWEKIAPWLPQNEFIITKEECRNETDFSFNPEIHYKIDTIEYYYRNIGCDYIKELNLSITPTLCVEYENLIKELRDFIPPSKNETKEICEQVEVDYFLGEANGCTGECYDKENSKCICLNDFHTKYYKKDLTIEWLDENCECVGNPECLKNNKLTCCSGKYKCGDYIVERLR